MEESPRFALRKIRPVANSRNSGRCDALARRSLIGDDKDGNLMG
jgi:hypothetical protein